MTYKERESKLKVHRIRHDIHTAVQQQREPPKALCQITASSVGQTCDDPYYTEHTPDHICVAIPCGPSPSGSGNQVRERCLSVCDCLCVYLVRMTCRDYLTKHSWLLYHSARVMTSSDLLSVYPFYYGTGGMSHQLAFHHTHAGRSFFDVLPFSPDLFCTDHSPVVFLIRHYITALTSIVGSPSVSQS